MVIEEYIKKHGFTWQAFADKAGVCRQTLYNIMTQQYNPRVSTANRIIQASNGEITLADITF